MLIINNLEFDHADIFDNLAAIQKSFSHLVRIVPRNGMVLVNADDANALEVVKESPAPILEVGFSENAAVRIHDVRVDGETQKFRLLNTEFTLHMSGTFNVRNASMAIAAAHFYQIPLPEIVKAVAAFTGVKRRQEVRGEVRGVTIIDDFGHHPTAMREDAARSAPSLPAPAALGALRAAQQYDPPRRFSRRTCPPPSRWPMAFSSRRWPRSTKFPKTSGFIPRKSWLILMRPECPLITSPTRPQSWRS